MTFKKGESGNVAGRPKGILNKRTQLAKLLEPHSENLITKAVELALGGDVQALRLCIERLIPKAEHAPIDLGLSDQFDLSDFPAIKSLILRATLEGKINVSEAEKLIILLSQQAEANPFPIPNPFPSDPNQAARIYQQFMNG